MLCLKRYTRRWHNQFMASGQTITRSARHILKQVQPRLWQIIFPFPAPTNCWLFKEDDGLTLVDAGHWWSGPIILDAAACIGQPIRRIVITHAHPDHAGAAGAVAAASGAVVLAHQDEAPFLTGQRSMAHEDGYWLSRAVLSSAKLVGVLDSPPIDPVLPVQHGDMIENLQVIHTPGHTPGSISLWSEREKAIFCGDNLIYSFRLLRVGLPWFTLDHSRQNSSLREYAERPARLLLSGHGPVFEGDVAAAVRRLL
jgi:glyoxylase-like metal-dependent hydrolase (beta-lactamase superfamily II)